MLGIRAQLATSDVPAPIESLTRGELRQSRKFRSGPACLDWLRGRAALKAVLAPGYDTSRLQFPNRAISLTHAGELAVAVRTDDDCEGIGIDFEPWGTQVDPRAAHLFLGQPNGSAHYRPTGSCSSGASRRRCTRPHLATRGASCSTSRCTIRRLRAARRADLGARPCATPRFGWNAAAWRSLFATKGCAVRVRGPWSTGQAAGGRAEPSRPAPPTLGTRPPRGTGPVRGSWHPARPGRASGRPRAPRSGARSHRP